MGVYRRGGKARQGGDGGHGNQQVNIDSEGMWVDKERERLVEGREGRAGGAGIG